MGSGASTTAAAAPEPKVEKSAHKSHGKGVSVSFHKSGSISGKIDWQGRSGQLCRATTPFKFVGLAKFHGKAELTPSGVQASGSGSASGKTSGGALAGTCEAPRTPVPTPPPAVALKPHPEPVAKAASKPELHAKVDSKVIPEKHSGSDSKTIPEKHSGSDSKTVPEPKPTPAGPTPGQLETPKSPPAEPPGNVFGYDEPVLGCFEGQVFPLAVDAPALPTNYDTLTAVSVVYACEWNIAPRSWDQGFPGVADRFEWFAIRYAGAFHTGAAGDYDFRVSSDDGAKVTIDGKLVVDNDGQHAPKEARGKVQLATGDHHMVLEYFQGPRFHINLQLWVTPPGKPEELFTVR
jgi:PA14 domain